jgi:hypothetical protein
MRPAFTLLALPLCLGLFGCAEKKKTGPLPTNESRIDGTGESRDGRTFSDAENKAIAVLVAHDGSLPVVTSDLEQPALEFQFGSRSMTELKDADFVKLRPVLEAVPRGVGLNLNLCDNVTDVAVAHLKGMANLKALSLGSTQVTPKCFDSLNTLNGLEYLYMDCNTATDDEVGKLAGLTKLRHLVIYSDKLTAAVYAQLKPLTKMRQFHLTRGMSDAGLANIKGWTKLVALEAVGGFRAKDKRLTDNGVANLKGMTELRELKLDSDKITDAALSAFAGMSKLEKLDLRSCGQITGAGLAKLKPLTALKSLDLTFTAVTKAERLSFQAAKPKVKITRTDTEK